MEIILNFPDDYAAHNNSTTNNFLAMALFTRKILNFFFSSLRWPFPVTRRVKNLFEYKLYIIEFSYKQKAR